MHGRIKVRTTLEQQEAKRKEREKKAATFMLGMKKVFENRYIDEKEMEVLQTTEKLLSANPDVTTLWNIRKEILQRKIAFEESTDQGDGDLEKMFQKELQFLQNCLHINPKSYAVFNQRVFVMKSMARPNWGEELRLCDMFLKYDERNFHCWDYRRFVVKNSDNVKPKDELEFTMKKISDNFSNYSAWHNRSKLLPLVNPSQDVAGKVEGKVLEKELELVQNAFFTDPNDQTAWIYHRWLLGRRELPVNLLSVILQRQPARIIMSFSKPVNLQTMSQNVFTLQGEPLLCSWHIAESIHGQKSKTKHSFIWITEHHCRDDEIELIVNLHDIPNVKKRLTVRLLNKDQNEACISWNKDELMENEAEFFSDSKVDVDESVLKKELSACQELLEIEPDIKWIILTIVYLMHAINPANYQHEIEELITKLIKIDPMRKGYYKDLRSKYLIERLIQKIQNGKEMISCVDLSKQELSTVYYVQYFTSCKTLLLNDNMISSVSFLKDLLYTKEIVLDNIENIVSQIEKMKEKNFLSHNIDNVNSSKYQLRLRLAQQLPV